MEIELSRLHRFIVEHFDREELRTLSFDLDVAYDDLGGEGRSAKARELVLWMQRRGKLDALVAALKESRRELFEKAGLSSASEITQATPDSRSADTASLTGSGAVAQIHSVAAGAGGAAIGRDVHGPVIIAGEGAHIAVTGQEHSLQDKTSETDASDEETPDVDAASPAGDGNDL